MADLTFDLPGAPDLGLMPEFQSYAATYPLGDVAGWPQDLDLGGSPTEAYSPPMPADADDLFAESSGILDLETAQSSTTSKPGIIDKLSLFGTDGRKRHQTSSLRDEESTSSSSPSSPQSPVEKEDEQDRNMKRQKRLIKNRESAQLSRQRKKLYVDDLERRVSELTARSEALEKHADALQRENSGLRDEVAELRAGRQPAPTPRLAGPMPAGLSAHTHSGKGRRPLSLGGARSAKAAGVCLLVVMFSFGLFFNANTGRRGELSLPAEGATTPAVFLGRALQSAERTPAFREADEVDETAAAAAVVKREVRTPKRMRLDSRETLPPTKRRDAAEPQPAQAQEAAVRVKLEPADRIADSETTPALEDAHAHSLVAHSAGPVSVARPSWRTRPATEYIYCPAAQQIRMAGPAGETPLAPGEAPGMIALLIPSDVFNSSATAAPGSPPSLVEVSCTVLEMNVYPFHAPPLNTSADLTVDNDSDAALQRA